MTVTIRSWQGALEALRTPDLRQALYDAGEKVMRDALITLHAEEHRQRRVVEMGVFGRGFFRSYVRDVFAPNLERLLGPAIASGRAEIIELGYRLSMNITADFAGIDRPLGSTAETGSLLALVKTFSEGATLVHSTRDPAEVNAEVDAAMAAFDRDFFQPSLERRRRLLQAGDPGRLPRDVLTTLLAQRSRLPLTDEVLRREMSFFLQAGAHSTTNSTAHALHEVFTWAGRDAARWRRLRDPAFVQRCVHESLRLHPASPVAWRRAVSGCPLGGRDVTAGEQVEIHLAEANRDTAVFGADADRFDPDRSLPDGVWPWGLTFGYGIHACLGRDLDGGIVTRGAGQDTRDATGEEPHWGTVPMLVHALLEADARPDPEDPAVIDTRTSRRNWGRYPVRFRGNPT